jgi:flagellin
MAGVNLGSTTYTDATAASIEDVTSATDALTKVKAAIDQLATDRATVGANNARLKYTSEQVSILNTNLTASNSRIKDVDVAEESAQYARYNILVQAGTAMLAQANTVPQSALRLLQ